MARDLGRDRTDRDHCGHASSDALEEIVRDLGSALLRGVGVADRREDAVRDVADQRDGRTGAHRREVHRERVREALLVRR